MKDVPYQDRDVALKKLWAAFKKARAEACIDHDMRRHESYEKPGERRRRERRQSARLKAKLKENFPERGKKVDKKKGDK